jgi:CubicO group peptidase (beta-lactamase class C family)
MAVLTVGAARSAARYVDSWLAYRQAYLRIPGVQVAILFEDQIVLSAAYGHADVEGDVALTPSHLFRVASHSKTFTATAIMQLVEAGTLGLDDKAGRWLAWLQSPVADLTLREMLGHSSGMFRDSPDSDFWQLSRAFPDGAELRAMALSPAAVVLPANERFKYSNVAYSLLGLVIEAASGMTYHDFVRTNVVDRLALVNTGPELDAARGAEYATAYSGLAYAPTRQPIAPVDTRAMASATGFYSTAEELCRYFSAHFTGDERLLTDASKRVLQHQWWEVDRTPDSGYGLGFAVTKVGDRQLLGHGGGFPGHITRTLFDPDARLVVAVLTNAIDGPAQELANSVVKLIDLAALLAPAEDVGQSRFCGRFANLWSVVDVASLSGRLLLLDPQAPDPTEQVSDLAVADDTTLRLTAGPGYSSVGEPMTYTFGTDGGVVSVSGPGGLTMWPLGDYRPPS